MIQPRRSAFGAASEAARLVAAEICFLIRIDVVVEFVIAFYLFLSV
jgi:hypothetical protein